MLAECDVQELERRKDYLSTEYWVPVLREAVQYSERQAPIVAGQDVSVMRFEEIGCFAQHIIIIHIIDDYVNEHTLSCWQRSDGIDDDDDDDDVAVDACGPWLPVP